MFSAFWFLPHASITNASVGLAFIGVTIQVVTFGSFPVVAFALAISFSVN
jgi:EamA domain-containing membrane protein RarD